MSHDKVSQWTRRFRQTPFLPGAETVRTAPSPRKPSPRKPKYIPTYAQSAMRVRESQQRTVEAKQRLNKKQHHHGSTGAGAGRSNATTLISRAEEVLANDDDDDDDDDDADLIEEELKGMLKSSEWKQKLSDADTALIKAKKGGQAVGRDASAIMQDTLRSSFKVRDTSVLKDSIKRTTQSSMRSSSASGGVRGLPPTTAYTPSGKVKVTFRNTITKHDAPPPWKPPVDSRRRERNTSSSVHGWGLEHSEEAWRLGSGKNLDHRHFIHYGMAMQQSEREPAFRNGFTKLPVDKSPTLSGRALRLIHSASGFRPNRRGNSNSSSGGRK